MPAFRRRVRHARPDLRIDELEPLAPSGDGADALREAFSELPHDRTAGARKALHYLQHGGSAGTLVASARRHLARNGRRSHDYKFTEAALENYGEMAPTAWRDRILAASMAYFTAIRGGAEPRCSRGAAVAEELTGVQMPRGVAPVRSPNRARLSGTLPIRAGPRRQPRIGEILGLGSGSVRWNPERSSYPRLPLTCAASVPAARGGPPRVPPPSTTSVWPVM